MPSPRPSVAALAGIFLALACANRSSPLARGEEGGDGGTSGSSGQSGASGAAATGGASGAGGGAGGAAAGAGGAAGQGGGGGAAGMSGTSGQSGAAGQPPVVVDEPDGPAEFRLLNGVTDVAAVQLCLVPWGPGGALGVDGAPQPAGGLAYGDLLTPALPGGFDAATTSLRPYVIGGDLAKAAGQGCLALAAAAPEGVKAVGLPVLPPGTLTAPRSRLAVATGCLGGFSVPNPIYACGQGIDPFVGNAGLVLVDLSRTAPAADRIGLQLVHASAASGPLRVVSVAENTTTSTLVGSLGPGQIAPRPPLQGTVDGLFGLNESAATVKIQDGTQGADLVSFPLPTSLADSGLSLESLAPGRGLVAVVLGPRPGGPASEAPPVAPTRLRWIEAPGL